MEDQQKQVLLTQEVAEVLLIIIMLWVEQQVQLGLEPDDRRGGGGGGRADAGHSVGQLLDESGHLRHEGGRGVDHHGDGGYYVVRSSKMSGQHVLCRFCDGGLGSQKAWAIEV